MSTTLIIFLCAVAVTLIIVYAILLLRIVVPTNEVHIVQSGTKVVLYGKDYEKAVYYNFPSILPVIGVISKIFPSTIFDIELKNYKAFDVGKVPFIVDIKAFFRISEFLTAAQRVPDFIELNDQLSDILKGSVRKILGSSDIEEAMQGRGRFGNAFTTEVGSQLKAWGVSTVKSIEFMDIRDADGSSVIDDIMEKKKSLIESQSRIEVANNNKTAQLSEIEAEQDTSLRRQESEEAIGKRQADKDREIGISSEIAKQAISEQIKLTKQKELEIQQFNDEKEAEIQKNTAIICAEKDKETRLLIAEAKLLEKEQEAKGIRAKGTAEAANEEAMQMAPVTAQIALLAEISDNPNYMEYLKAMENIKAGQIIGVAKAAAMEEADVKIIANGGDIETGMSSAMDLFSSKGGTNIAAMLEGITQSPEGRLLVKGLIAKLAPENK